MLIFTNVKKSSERVHNIKFLVYDCVLPSNLSTNKFKTNIYKYNLGGLYNNDEPVNNTTSLICQSYYVAIIF